MTPDLNPCSNGMKYARLSLRDIMRFISVLILILME